MEAKSSSRAVVQSCQEKDLKISNGNNNNNSNSNSSSSYRRRKIDSKSALALSCKKNSDCLVASTQSPLHRTKHY
jgi:hypothetical protein